MDITIDTSVILAVVCGESGRDRAIELTVGQSLIAPASLHWEIGNALSAMLKHGRITLTEAKACLGVYQKIPIKFVDVDLKQALAITNKVKAYAYDAYMLVCAQQTGSPLLTLDTALRAHAEALGVEVLEI